MQIGLTQQTGKLQFGGESPLTMRAQVVYGRYAIGHRSVHYGAINYSLADESLPLEGKLAKIFDF